MLKIAQQQAGIANEKYDYYKKNTRPIEDELIQKAKTGQDANYNAGKAGANVGFGFKSAGRAANRYLQGVGINQDDPRYAAAQKDLNLAEAAAKAGASNTAREGTREYNQNLRYAIAGFSLPSQEGAMNAINTTGLAYGNAGQGANQGQALALQGQAANRQNATSQFMAGLDTRQFENTRDYNNQMTDLKIEAANNAAKNTALSALGSALPMAGAIGGGMLGGPAGAAAGGGLGGALAGGLSGGGMGAATGGALGAGGGFIGSGGLQGINNWFNQESTPSFNKWGTPSGGKAFLQNAKPSTYANIA
jgi:hypothetical protein